MTEPTTPPSMGAGDAPGVLVEAVLAAWNSYERHGTACTFEGNPMVYASTLEELADLARRVGPSAAPDGLHRLIDSAILLARRDVVVRTDASMAAASSARTAALNAAAPDAGVGEREGFVLVPLEPTEAMCLAGESCEGSSSDAPFIGGSYTPENVELIYKAMLNSAPSARALRWTERWVGSGPDCGWWVWGVERGNPIAYVGEGDHSKRLTSIIVEKHNAALTSRPSPAVQPDSVNLGASDGEADTLDIPLPADVTVGPTTFRKGVSLKTFIGAARRWREAAYPPVSPEDRAAFQAALRGGE